MHWEQFEVWSQNGGSRWELIAAFNDFELASALARNHLSRMRLIHAIYDDGKRINQDILVELGSLRNEKQPSPPAIIAPVRVRRALPLLSLIRLMFTRT